MTARKKKNALDSVRVYIGPSILGLSANTIFNGEYPPHVKKIIEERPAVAGLIVPLTNLQEARKNVTVPGHILNHYLKKLK